jgi:hypothetical protein
MGHCVFVPLVAQNLNNLSEVRGVWGNFWEIVPAVG